MAGADHHVSLRGLTHAFREGPRALTALANVGLDVAWGQFLSVIGPTGCGKSTLLRIVGGLLKPSEGEVLIEGEAPSDAQRRREIGLVAQDPALLPWRTVLGNVRLPLEIDRAARRRPAPSPEELLELTGLADFHGYYPHELSGGMQQRVAIARALAFDPSLLLMDEPFGALDEITRSAMRYELLRIWSAGGAAPSGRKTVMFVTHSIAEAIALSDRVVVLSPRPGSVRASIDIELSRPRTQEMERSEPFLDYADQLRNLLKEAPA
jgi:NitT/TauT family transport system ATP-binding protein